jgi:hypothetical protein
MRGRKVGIVTMFVVSIAFFFSFFASAQATSSGLSEELLIQGEVVNEGDVIISRDNEFFVSSEPYIDDFVGVVSREALISVIEKTSEKGKYPVIRTGTALINVTGYNGSIKRGDLITTSPIKGHGMLADHAGYVLGYALSDFEAANKESTGKIDVMIDKHYVTEVRDISDFLRVLKLGIFKDPIITFKYILAAGVLLAALTIGISGSVRTARHGIDALGRNPLAGDLITPNILLNVIVSIVICVVGFLLAVAILRF